LELKTWRERFRVPQSRGRRQGNAERDPSPPCYSRVAERLSLGPVAAAGGYGQYMSKIEQGVCAPSLKTYDAIARARETNLSDLFAVYGNEFEDMNGERDFRDLQSWLRENEIDPQAALALIQNVCKLFS